MPAICCSVQRHPEDPTLCQYLSNHGKEGKFFLAIPAILAVVLLTLGTLALVGLHHPTSALGPFGAGVSMAGAASMVGIGSLAALFTGLLVLALCKAYRENCDELARPLSREETNAIEWLGYHGLHNDRYRILRTRLMRNGMVDNPRRQEPTS